MLPLEWQDPAAGRRSKASGGMERTVHQPVSDALLRGKQNVRGCGLARLALGLPVLTAPANAVRIYPAKCGC